MPKRMGIVFLTVSLLLSSLFFVGYGLAENDGSLHLYREIPFETPTQEAVLEALLEKADASFRVSNEIIDGRLEIFDFGYPWTLQTDFLGKKGIDRMLLSSAQTARVEPEDWPARLRSDLLEFMDVEGQLTALYGEPDERFFFMNDGKEKYMFADGTWEIEPMLSVDQEYRVVRSLSLGHSWLWIRDSLRTLCENIS